MKNVNVLLLVVATFICSTNCMEKSEKEMFQAAKNMFQTWKAKNGKRYDNETQEEKRFQIWFNNKKNIDEHNTRFAKGLETYTKELHKHHDKTIKEFLALSTGAKPPTTRNMEKIDTNIIVSRQNLPTSVNHTNLLPPVKDQGQCG